MMNPSDRTGLGVIRVCIQIVGCLAIALHLIAFIWFTFISPIPSRDSDLYDEWKSRRLDTLYGRNQLLAVAMLLSFIEFLVSSL